MSHFRVDFPPMSLQRHRPSYEHSEDSRRKKTFFIFSCWAFRSKGTGGGGSPVPAYPSASSFAVEDDGGSVASMASLASKDSQVRQQRCSSPACFLARLSGFITCFPWQCVSSARVAPSDVLFFFVLILLFCAVGRRHVIKTVWGDDDACPQLCQQAACSHPGCAAVEGHGIFQIEFLGIEKLCSLHRRLPDPATALIVGAYKRVCTKPAAASSFATTGTTT